MRVIRMNSLQVSYEQDVEPRVTYSDNVEFKWATGGDQRGASWVLRIGPYDFQAMAKAMIGADRDAALDAFASAIAGRRRKVPRE